MSDNAKGGEKISPVRVSRLKKRRRPNTAGANSSPQNPLEYAKNIRGTAGIRHHEEDSGRHCKENLLNGLPSSTTSVVGTSIDAKKNGIVGKRAFGFAASSLKNRNSSLLPSEEEVISGINSTSRGRPNQYRLANNENGHTLSFIDEMEQASVLALIPSMLGVDMTQYSNLLPEELERAFEYKKGSICYKKNSSSATSRRNGIHHKLVGRIDPHPIGSAANLANAIGRHNIRFPEIRSSFVAYSHERPEYMLFGHLNFARKTNLGMRIPSSWYEFPCQPSGDIPFPEGCKSNDNEGFARKRLKMNETQPSFNDSAPTTKTFEGDNFAETNDVEPTTLTPKLDENKHSTRQELMQTENPLKYLGKIRIVSDKGATIREAYDIDQSEFVVGKLHENDERHFVEKRTLLPPPISLLDGSDEESEDECVAVVRYKIVLRPSDCQENGPSQTVGWISDRGRLADEPYLILREV
ncbi:hypothetical protein ACHAWF_015159 [Thalassiosira exigua]